MLCLDGVYASRLDGGLRFRRLKAPEREELEDLVQRIAERVGRALEQMGLLQRDAESAWLDLPPIEDTDAMRQQSKLEAMRSRLEPSVAGTGSPNSSQSVGGMGCVPASFSALMRGASRPRSCG
jgi:hypothetical protein